MYAITHILMDRSMWAKNYEEMEIDLGESVVTEHVSDAGRKKKIKDLQESVHWSQM